MGHAPPASHVLVSSTMLDARGHSLVSVQLACLVLVVNTLAGAQGHPWENAWTVVAVQLTSIALVVTGNPQDTVAPVPHARLGNTGFFVYWGARGSACRVLLAILDFTGVAALEPLLGHACPVLLVLLASTLHLATGLCVPMVCVPAVQPSRVLLGNTGMGAQVSLPDPARLAAPARLVSTGQGALALPTAPAPTVCPVHPRSTGVGVQGPQRGSASHALFPAYVATGQCSGSTRAPGITSTGRMGQCSTQEPLPCPPCLARCWFPLAPPPSTATPSLGACRSGLWGRLDGTILWLEARGEPMH